MPHEPDPEDRGFYWATRFTETRNTYNYMPDHVYDNIEVDLFGRPLTKETVCATTGCIPLEEDKRHNVVGESLLGLETSYAHMFTSLLLLRYLKLLQNRP